jgi:AraC-like DNA-binding protein
MTSIDLSGDRAWHAESASPAIATLDTIDRLPKRFSRAWPGLAAEVIDVRGPRRYLEDLSSPHPRLVIVLEEVGDHVELRTDVNAPAPAKAQAPHRLAFLSPGARLWAHADQFRYLRLLVVDFDLPTLTSGCSGDAKLPSSLPPRLIFANSRLWALASLLADECLPRGATNLSYGNSLGCALFHALMRQIDGEIGGRQRGGLPPKLLKLVLERIERSVDDTVALKDLADLAGFSQGYFARAFKVSTGMSPHHWLLTARVRHAQQMLLDTEIPLAEVALVAGFSDQSHFSRVFRKHTGEPPGAWRRRHCA